VLAAGYIKTGNNLKKARVRQNGSGGGFGNQAYP